MKFPVEFQPRRVLHSAVIFLIFICPFCAWGDLDFDYDSGEDSFGFPSATDSTTIETGTGTETGKTAPELPRILVVAGEYSWRQFIECRGADVSNMKVIPCDGNILDCRSKLSCLLNGTMCTNHDGISVGETCFVRQSSFYFSSRVHHSRFGSQSGSGDGTGNETEKCLKVRISWPMRAGIIKCISSFPSPSSASSSSWDQPNPSKTTSITTLEYFYTGPDSKEHLLSSRKPQNKTMMKLEISYSGREDTLTKKAENETAEPQVFYTNEPLAISCTTVNFFIDPNTIKIEARTENGTELQIDPELCSETSSYSSTAWWYKSIRRFRVPKDIQSFNCVGRRLDTFEVVRTTTNINVMDPPSPLLVKAPHGSKFQVDSPVGCNLYPSHTAEEFRTIKSNLYSLLDISRRSDFWITSPIAFLRFQNITKGNFSCSPLKPDGNSNSNSTDRFDYYFDLEVKKPRIEKPADGDSTVALSGDNHRSLKCKYTGNPMPYVIWLQNGKEIFYTVGTKLSTDEPGFETAVLHLPLENPSDFPEISNDLNSNFNSNSNLHVIYSCVAQNHLGVDQLDFKIENEKLSAGVSGTSRSSSSHSKSKSEEKGNGLFYGLIISCLCVIILIGIVFNLIQGKRRTKRAVVSKRRGDERGAYSPRVGEFSYVDSGNASNPIENPNHNHTEIPNNGVSYGISTPNKFQSGEAKYQVFT